MQALAKFLPRWPILALGLILIVAGALRLVLIEQNGFGTPYYAAAVRSMALSWHNFFFAAFDPLGFLAIDKPPVAFWLQVLSVKLLGFDNFALIKALDCAEAGSVQPYSYTLLVWATVLGALVFHNFPDGFTLLGASIIVASGLYTWHHDRQRQS